MTGSLQNQNPKRLLSPPAYQRRRLHRLTAAVLSVTGAGGVPEPPADVSALYEVQVVPVVAARPDQDAQEVQVVAEVLAQRRPGAADREETSQKEEPFPR